MEPSRRYLLVDDNEALVENIADILSDAGAAVDVAFAGDEALERAKQRRYEALISDMRMPSMSGTELVHQIRRVDPALPIIVVSADAGDDELSAVAREGLLAVLPKPTPIDRLVTLLSSARRGGLVAIVEDDLALCDNLAEALQTRGFSTVTASSMAQLEAHLGPVPPAIALADLRVPGGPAGAALAWLDARFPEVATIVITGRPDRVLRGFPVFIKPFDMDALLEAVERLYRGQQLPKA